MDPFRMLRPIGVAPNPNAGLRPAVQRIQNEEKDAERPGMVRIAQQTRVMVPPSAPTLSREEEKQGMKRGGKVKRKPKGKKAVKKAGGISQVQTVKVNINTGRVKREKRKKSEKPATQPAFNMFGYRLAPSMPIMGGTPGLSQQGLSSQQDNTKMDLVLSKIAQQRKEMEKQQKAIEDIQSTRRPTVQPAASSLFGPASAPIPTDDDITEEFNIASAGPMPSVESVAPPPLKRRFKIPEAPAEAPIGISPTKKGREPIVIAGETITDARRLTNEQRRELGLSPVGRPRTKKGSSEPK